MKQAERVSGERDFALYRLCRSTRITGLCRNACPAARHDLHFVDLLEALAAVELLRRLVGAASLDDSVVGLRLGRERGPNQCGADSSRKQFGSTTSRCRSRTPASLSTPVPA